MRSVQLAVRQPETLWLQKPVGDDQAKPNSSHGEVVVLPTVVVVHEYPAGNNWCEVVPERRRTPREKERRDDDR